MLIVLLRDETKVWCNSIQELNESVRHLCDIAAKDASVCVGVSQLALRDDLCTLPAWTYYTSLSRARYGCRAPVDNGEECLNTKTPLAEALREVRGFGRSHEMPSQLLQLPRGLCAMRA